MIRVKVKSVSSKEEEQVVIECVSMTQDFVDIRNYCLSKGNYLIGYSNTNHQHQICFDEILYFEAVGENVFAYTLSDVFEIKKRLYELEEELAPYKFIRCSKAFLICLLKIDYIRPAFNGRYCAHMKNGEDVIISRKYAQIVKKTIMEEL